MKIQDLYKKYDIMPQLAIHQLRVAGVTKIISDSWENTETARECVIACLLHDMGNIVKFKGLTDKHWIEVQKRYMKSYGENAHVATHAILRKEGLEKYIDYLEEEAELFKVEVVDPNFAIMSKPALMVTYADLRVAITGVVSIQERIQDLIKRYKEDRVEERWVGKLERYIQQMTDIDVTSITEDMVSPLFDTLLTYNI